MRSCRLPRMARMSSGPVVVADAEIEVLDREQLGGVRRACPEDGGEMEIFFGFGRETPSLAIWFPQEPPMPIEKQIFPRR